jgi:hypothetical protein
MPEKEAERTYPVNTYKGLVPISPSSSQSNTWTKGVSEMVDTIDTPEGLEAQERCRPESEVIPETEMSFSLLALGLTFLLGFIASTRFPSE